MFFYDEINWLYSRRKIPKSYSRYGNVEWKRAPVLLRSTCKNGHQNLHSELVASNRILVFAQRFLESPRGKHCNSLEGNIWRKVVSTSNKRFWREINAFSPQFYRTLLIMMLMRGQRKFLLELPRNML